MQNSITQARIILASQSPRRKYLLQKASLAFEVIPSTIDESAIELSTPADYVKELANAKAQQVAGKHPDGWVIGADTIVTIDGQILGKPASENDARNMLVKLSGKVHQVYTGVCICCISREHFWSHAVATEVQFKHLTDAEIEWYIHSGEPFDKAGAYSIQGLGTFLVRGISGSYTNVVGLPVCEVIEHLIQHEIIGFRI